MSKRKKKVQEMASSIDHAEIEAKVYGPRGVPSDDPFRGIPSSFPDPNLPQPQLLLPAQQPSDGSSLKELPMMQSSRRPVTVVERPDLDYPEMYLTVYFLHQSAFEFAQFAMMFAKARCMKADNIDEADLVVFTGGTDVDPSLYGKKPHHRTETPDKARDNYEIGVFKECLEKGVPMLGICRGAQFLHVMNGGKLFQHVDNHTGNHTMFDPVTKSFIDKVSSVHHQMVEINDRMEVHGHAHKSQTRHVDDKVVETGNNADIEAFFYPDTLCLGIQGHPEYAGYDHFTRWSLQFIESAVAHNPDLEWLEGDKAPRVRRLKPDLINQRKFELPAPVLERIKKESL